MTTSVATLVTAKTAPQILADLLKDLGDAGFPVASWQPGAVPRSLVFTDATALAVLHRTVADLALAAFLDTATGDWLSLLAASRFQVDRTAAVATVGKVVVTVASGVGPYTITAGGLLVTDGARRWRSTNTGNVTISSASPVTFDVRAEAAGAAYNVANSAITGIVSPALAGVSVANPIYSGGTWITTAGADAEGDALLRQRCRDRWATLGRGATVAAYQYLARTGHAAAAQVTRTAVSLGSGDGTLRIFLAGPAGPVDGAVVTTVQAWIDTYSPATDAPTVESAAATSVTVTATVRVAAASDSTANRALATDALAAYFAALGIGEQVDLGRLYEAIYRAAGVVDVDISAPSGDTSVASGHVAVPTVALTWVTV